jgi:DUF4097 and DUF4098 domain-containing protein YvlB
MKLHLIASILLLLPVAAFAQERHCEASQPRNLQLDLSGVQTVVFDIGANDVDITATPNAGNKVEGRACASDAKLLDQLTLTQERIGDKLVVHAERQGSWNISMGSHYAYMKLKANVPDSLMVQLKVGSGDASIDGARAASADVGSGDIKATRIRGEFTADVGSGDLIAEDIGSLHILSVGSGDATIRQVRGASKVGDIGSGDLEIHTTQGTVEVGSVASGDVTLTGIGGDVSVGSVGSGDVGANGVHGNFTVHSIGSGDVSHNGVTGRVDVPKDEDD